MPGALPSSPLRRSGGNIIKKTAAAKIIDQNSGVPYGNLSNVGSIKDLENDNVDFRFGDQRVSANIPIEAVGHTILGDTTITFVPGVSYNASTIAFFDNAPAADTITDSANGFVAAGLVAGDTITVTGSASNNGTYTIATIAPGTITLTDAGALTNEAAGASVTLTSANNKIDFGVDLVALTPFPVAVVGFTTNILGLSLTFIKDSDVDADENIYNITSLTDGGTTNSVAILSEVDGVTIPNFTSTTGTAKIVNPIHAASTSTVGGSPLTVNVFARGEGDGTGAAMLDMLDSCNFQFARAVFNIGDLSGAMHLDVNLGPLFGQIADVPFKVYSTFGGPAPDAPDHIWLARTADPTNLAPFGPGGQWYNSTSGRFKYYDGSAVQEIPKMTDLTASGALFDATVNGGGGADYTTVEAALAAGNTRILVTGNTTETTNWTPASNVLIYTLPSVQINMNTRQATTNVQYTFRGFGELRTARTTAVPCITTGRVDWDGMTLRVENTSGSSPFCSAGEGQSYKNIILICPNLSNAGLSISAPNAVVDNIAIFGGGTSCDTCVVVESGVLNNVVLYGSFAAGSAAALHVGGECAATNIQATLSSATAIRLNGGVLSNVKQNGSGSNLDVWMYLNGSELNNCSINQLNFNNVSFCNVTGLKAVQIAFGTGAGNNFNGVRLAGGTFNITSDRTKICGFNSVGGGTISGDNVTISTFKVGADAGGGTNTITVDAAADQTKLIGGEVDDAGGVVDNGTNTTFVAVDTY